MLKESRGQNTFTDFNYRTTPHSTTGFPPAELLFNLKVHNKLPQLISEMSVTSALVQRNDAKSKTKMKKYADMKKRASPSPLKIGDIVLARQRKQNKLSIRFDSNPFQVVRKKGTMVTAYRNGKYITRNISHFKVIDPSLNTKQINEEDEEDDLNTSDIPAIPEHQVLAAPQVQAVNPLRRSSRIKNLPQR